MIRKKQATPSRSHEQPLSIAKSRANSILAGDIPIYEYSNTFGQAMSASRQPVIDDGGPRCVVMS